MNHDGWIEHDSSHLSKSKYNAFDRTLDIQFQNGGVYRYHGVPPGEHQAFLSAPSQGQYLHMYIKDYYHAEQLR